MSPPYRLLIMRHAHAELGRPGQDDFDRALTAQGREQAGERREAVVRADPQVVLCSAATRAVQTLSGLGPLPGRVIVDERLYHASATSLLLRLAELPADVATAMVVGHLPTVGQLATALLSADQPPVDFEPASIVDLELPDVWSDLRPGSARLRFWQP